MENPRAFNCLICTYETIKSIMHIHQSMSARLYLRSDNYLASHEKEMIELEVCQEGIDIMVAKMRHLTFMVRELDPRAANVLKQEMLAADGEAAIPYHALSDLSKPTDCLISGTQRQFQIVVAKLVTQPFGLKALAEDLAEAMKALDRPRERPRIMGILNATPDSFSDGGEFLEPEAAIAHAKRMKDEGADIIDIGGESTRPGAEIVSPEQQLERVLPVIQVLKGHDLMISIDSRSHVVVERAIQEGASMANLVGGLRDKDMANVLAGVNVPIVLMHMQGEPHNMQDNPEYQDVMDDIVDWAREQISVAEEAGIGKDRVIIDPGIGFGKTLEHNLEIINRLGELRVLGVPILLGPSRKSFIGKITGAEAGQRLEGSLAAAVLGHANGADILRVHDVKETALALAVAHAVHHG